MLTPLLAVGDVAELVGYPPRRIRSLVRDGRFPAPVDIDLHPHSWRWSPVVIELYQDGHWPWDGAA